MTETYSRINFRPEGIAPRGVFQCPVTAGPCTVWQAIEAAVDEIEDDSLRGLSPNVEPPFAQARTVLASLTLCYVLQIYSSTDAADIVARDLYAPCLCGEAPPDACELRRFRAENREAIHRCLTAALHFLAEQKINSGVVTRVNPPPVAEEANRRIIMAMFVDSMELDGEKAGEPAG